MDIQSDFITLAGCGSMGLPMARRLQKSGFNIFGYDIRPRSDFPDFSQSMLSDPISIAESKVLISVVRDERQTLDLCLDDQGIFRRDRYPKVLIVSSTLSPRFFKYLATRLPVDVNLIDAPMSGAPIAAERGNLTFMLGGHEATVKSLMSLFHTLGGEVFYCGGVSSGMTLKVLNNYVAAASVVAVRRAFEMAHKLEVDVEQLRKVMRVSSGSTWYGDKFDDISWARQGYDQENTIGILEKDVRSALDAVVDISELEDSPLDSMILELLRQIKPYER
ncbi:MAG: NAD(P)-dependent oxidoreductase [bacterium]